MPVIGYHIRPNKVQAFNWEGGFIPAANKRGYDVIPYDATDDSVHVDIIIAKLTDEFGHPDDPKAVQIIENFRKAEARGIPIIDPVDSQEMVSDRVSLNKKLHDVDFKSDHISVPEYCVINEESEFESSIATLEFPVMMKTIVASGSLAAHEMAIVFNKEQLKGMIKYPSFIQEYKNHNGTIYKVSVIGKYVTAATGSSTRNFNISGNHEPVVFNSQHMKDIIDPESHKSQPDLSQDDIEHIRACLCDHFGMDLIGFDAIRCADSNRILLIDINFFPSFRTVPDVFEKMLDLFDSHLKRESK